MEALDKIKRAHVAIMRHHEFCQFSGILACGEVIIDPNCPTAATNGWDVRYGPAFIAPLRDKQVRFLVLHENMHKAYKHLWLWKALYKENARLANMAADYFINTALIEADPKGDFIEFVEGGIPHEPKYIGWSVLQIFSDLKQQQQQKQKQGGSGSGSGDEDGDEQGGLDAHEWDDAEDGSGKGAERTQQERDNEIERALRHGEVVRKNLARGRGDGNSAGKFGDLLTPEVDWRNVLREFVQETCAGRDDSTWRRPARRYIADNIYMPSCISERMEHLVIGMDTSGSCFGTSTMTRFVTELATIIEHVKPSKVTVIYWDSSVRAVQEFEDGQFALADLKPYGGGGTDGSVLFDYLRDKQISPAAIVQFTDGYVGDWGTSEWPTLWAITSKHLVAPFGTSLHITD